MWNLCGSSKLVTERELHREHYQHQLKLMNIRPRIDMGPPKPMSHLESKARKKRVQSDRNEIIRRENQLLLKKMMEIDIRPSSATISALKRVPSTGSLNRFVRISELTKISRENQSILHRLQRTQSAYSVKRWAKQSEYNDYLKMRLSQNAGRVPRTKNYDISSFVPTPSSRPMTAQYPRSKDEFEHRRPMTAEGRTRSLKASL